ncbi:group II intron maturase-specific domain-containing protein [Salmonella enterica]|uniref:group II intron maturase-specific domain-containing protein n=1 Tax=Salmonella enterica TaxID=28901 RepID=UPI00391C6EF7
MIDSHIWRLLWKWTQRRHPTKGARWVKQRYFRANGQRSWNFATKELVGSSTADLWLFRASTIAITRHVKVRGLANPFDPAWASYFVYRRASRRSVRLSGASPWC